MTRNITSLALLTTALLAGTAQAEPDAKATYQDIQNTLGLVPTFFKAFPEDGLAGAWDELKSVQLNPKTALSMKQKELIGLAVAAQIPCRYCVYFHTNVGTKLGGANDTEIKEAIAMAAITRHWSTVLNGSLIDEDQFRKEVDQIVAGAKKAAKK